MKGLGSKVGGNEGGLAMIGDMMKFIAPLLGVKPNFQLKPARVPRIGTGRKEG